MTGDTEWDPQLARLESVQTKYHEESHKICEIARVPKVHKLETDIIIGGIWDVIIEQAMIEKLVASIKFRGVKVNAMKSKTIHSVIMPEEVSQKFSIGIEKSKDTLISTTH